MPILLPIAPPYVPPLPHPSPQVESVGAGATGTGTAATLSWGHNIGGNALIVGIHHGDQAATTSTAQVGATSLGLLQSFQYYTTGSNHFYVDFFGMIKPPTGAQTLSIGISSAIDFVAANSISISGALSFGSSQTASGSGTALSQVVTAALYQLIVQMFGNGQQTTAGVMSGYNQTQDWYAPGVSSPFTNYGTLIGHAPGDVSVNFSATGTNIQWGGIAVPVSTSGIQVKGTPNVSTTNSVTIPAHQPGDIIVIYAYTAGSTVAPAPPAASGTVPAWVTIDATTGANNVASGTFYFVATSSSHTSGSWTLAGTASNMAAVVLPNQGASTVIGGHAETGGTNAGATGATAPLVTLANNDGSSALLHFFGYSSNTNPITYDPAPSGYTQQASNGVICIDTKNDTTSASTVTETNNAGSGLGWRAATVEIRAH